MTAGFGVIADDITGACDVAAGVTTAGVRTEVRLGVPTAAESPDEQCIVVALKSRTAAPAEAIAESVAALSALRAWGTDTIYQKYCSTFDSTDEGNIGPVADALLDAVGPRAITVGTPATPAADRTVHRGHLFVGDRLLSESALAQHPLTPMTDADLVRVLGRQTTRPVASIGIEDVRAGSIAVRRRIEQLRARGVRHVLVDAVVDADLDVLAEAVEDGEDLVLGGAAGFAAALARRRAGADPGAVPPDAPPGRRLILSGSASERTREQVAAFGGPASVVDPDAAVTEPAAVIRAAIAFAAAQELPLVSATAEPHVVRGAQSRWGVARSAAALEGVLAAVAVRAVDELDVRRILIAGGETSGAVAHALGVRRLRVRRVISPGVPWMTATDAAGRSLDLCFKSGNFGETGLFRDAWEDE